MKRANVIFAAGVLLVVVAVVLAYLFTVAGRAPAAAVGARPAPAAVLAARLVSVSGAVQVRNGEDDWLETQAGASLAPGARVRTGDDARAELAYGDDVRVELGAGSEVRLADLRDDLARLVVGEGLVFADVRPGHRRLQIANASGDTLTETRDGALFVTAEPTGAMRTAVTRGSAAVTAHGETVSVGEGFYTVAAPGKGPSAPAAVPPSLLLKVRWPAEAETAKRRHVVSGTTAPGARLRIGESKLWADAKGRFQTVVELREGKNRIQVRAVDLVGREARDDSHEIELDTRAPRQSIETSPDMWRH